MFNELTGNGQMKKSETNIDDIEPFRDNRNKNMSQYYRTMENKKTQKDKVQSTNRGSK